MTASDTARLALAAEAHSRVFSWAWFRRRSLFFVPFAVITGAAFGGWHGVSMGTTAEGVDLSIRSVLSCLLVVSLGPVLAILVRERGLNPKAERLWVVAAVAIGLVVGYFALQSVDDYHDALMGRHGVEEMARSTQAQTLTRLFSAFFNQGPRWVVFIVAGGGDALIAYFSERRRLAVADLRTQKDVADAKLAVLQAQVEPHFLFNTLASVRSLVRADPDRAVLTIDALADYLRATMPKFRAESGMLSSTLGEQIDRCTSYLTLMNVRMDGRMTVTVEAPPQVRDLPFPPLVLISLVENAVRHGLEPKAGRGEIRIRAERTGDLLEVAVQDDGAGLSPGVSDTGGVGLANVRSQLQNRFGRDAALEVSSRPGGGVRAVIRIPLQP
jgi:signal transduction histidine kinase